jgi:hypothetical protein
MSGWLMIANAAAPVNEMLQNLPRWCGHFGKRASGPLLFLPYAVP